MFDPEQVEPALLEPVAHAVHVLTDAVPSIAADDLMLVGAYCRDAMHSALGHTTLTRATRDLDLALALRSWHSFQEVAAAFQRRSESGVCYLIGGFAVDVLPFGAIENPVGTVNPPTRKGPMSVWGFDEIYAASLRLTLPGDGGAIAMPTVPGYAAAKLAAWLDRAAFGEFKDAGDLALIAHWFAESPAVADRLYESADGEAALKAEGFDVTLASARLLGIDVIELIGPDRQAELLTRWPGDQESLIREFRTGTGHPAFDTRRRAALLRALTDGLRGPQ